MSEQMANEQRANEERANEERANEEQRANWIGRLAASSFLAQHQAMEALVEVGGAAVPALCRAIEDCGPVVRLAAVQVLGRIGDPAATRVLCDALADPDAAVRGAAVQALGDCGSVEAAPFLCRSALHRFPGAHSALERLLNRVPAARERALEHLRGTLSRLGSGPLLPNDQRENSLHPTKAFRSEVMALMARIGDGTLGAPDLPLPAEQPTRSLPLTAAAPPLDPSRLPRPAPPPIPDAS